MFKVFSRLSLTQDELRKSRLGLQVRIDQLDNWVGCLDFGRPSLSLHLNLYIIITYLALWMILHICFLMFSTLSLPSVGARHISRGLFPCHSIHTVFRVASWWTGQLIWLLLFAKLPKIEAFLHILCATWLQALIAPFHSQCCVRFSIPTLCIYYVGSILGNIVRIVAGILI